MSLIQVNTSVIRALALAALVSSPAAALALPQTVTAGATQASTRAGGGRIGRCVACSDSARARHELLLNKLDSLRWEFSNRRLTRIEQDSFAREIDLTLTALRQAIESSGARVRLVPDGRVERMAGSSASAGAGEAYTFTLQVTKRGYLGATFDGPNIGYPEDGPPEVIRFLQYPRIATIDPASPAERAGLLMGDTLLAMGGVDVVENSITLSKMLVPNEKLTLKVRRDGDAKEFRVIVGEAPAYVARRMTPMPPMALPGEVVVVGVPGVEAPVAPGAPSVRTEIRTRAPRPAEAPSATPLPPTPSVYWDAPMAAGVFVTGRGLAGARIETIPEGLARNLGVKEGVLVKTVPAGSPAYMSGLREGDVIISVDGAAVRSAGQLITVDRENGVKLVVVRDQKKRELTLRWK